MRKLTVKYPNDCRKCGKKINKGDQALYEKSISAIFCLTCQPTAEEMIEYQRTASPRMTTRERKERRVEKRQEWAKSREQKSNQAFDASSKLASGIPIGQPILVGHHSEKHHRRDVDRIQSLASKSVEHGEMADTHLQKAEGIQAQLDTTIFSDDPDAIEQLQKKLSRLESRRDRMKLINKEIKKGDGWEERAQITKAEGEALLSNAKRWGCKGFMPYELTNIGARIRNIKKRIERLSWKKDQGIDSNTVPCLI